MDDKEFQKNIEKRTIEVRFRHSNGRDFFCEPFEAEYEDCNINEEMRKILSGKTIEKQMEYFYVTESRKFYHTAYGEITKENLQRYAVRLCDYEGVRALLVKDRILVGAKIDAMWGEGNLLLKKPVCTYYACDNEGSGTKEREDNAYLIFKDWSSPVGKEVW